MGTPPIQMANLGMADTLIIMVIALVVAGPRRLPQIGRQIGKLMYEFRKASNDFKFQMEEELRSAEDADRRKKDAERIAAQAAAAPAPKLSAPEAMASLIPAETPAAYPPEATTPEPVTPVVEPVPDPAPTEEAEETYPRILPPSNGEQVLAARPNSLTALAKAARDENERAAAEASSDPVAETYQPAPETPAASNPDTPTESEQAAQHA